MPAAIDASPIATIGQPPTVARYAPNAAATANATIIARFIAAAEISPALTARSGPMRSGPSAPATCAAAPLRSTDSWVPRELREVGCALLEERFLAFATFVGRVVHQR